MPAPNILFIMTDQQRFDTIAALGYSQVYTPNLDRLARRGVAFTNAYSPCPVCVPARYVIRTGCEPGTTGCYDNGYFTLVPGQAAEVEERCGPFLARRMGALGYRTFGIGKFHAYHDDLGYDTFLRAEEMWGSTREERLADAYGAFLSREHPEFDFLEQPHGERTEMYYMPQISPLPAAITYEAWTAARAIELLQAPDDRPYFGFVSFIGPHPPLAPPIPFNRLYNPDDMPLPVPGDPVLDALDEQVTWMNHAIWADEIGPMQARAAKARYYGEISYMDACVGELLDAVEARADAENTLICFFADHGDHLGDHRAWQKESFFEASCRIPFLLSWPARLPSGTQSEILVSLVDLFGIATVAAGQLEVREGIDVIGALTGQTTPRDLLFGVYGTPGTARFKIMARRGPWKYIFLANGGYELLFHLRDDPVEQENRAVEDADTTCVLRAEALTYMAARPGLRPALCDGDFLALPFEARPPCRIQQMQGHDGAKGFPEAPGDGLAGFHLFISPGVNT